MSFELPQRRVPIRQIQTSKRNVPLEQIIAIQGQNPLAMGIQSASEVLGKSLQQRAALRQQGQQIAQLAALTGQTAPTGPSPLDADTYLKGLTAKAAFEKINSEGKPKPLQGTITKDGKTYQPFYNEKSGDVTYEELLGPKNAPPRGLQFAGMTPEGLPISFDPNSGKTSTPGGQEYAGPSLPKNVGTEEQRRISLIKTGKQAISDVNRLLTPGVLSEIKAIRLSPGKVYSQLASSEAKELYTNLRRAMENEVYLRTGATANPTELENSVVANMAALNDSPDDFFKRMSLLDASISNFNMRGGLQPISKTKPTEIQEPDVANYAKKYGMTYQEALALKKQRTGK